MNTNFQSIKLTRNDHKATAIIKTIKITTTSSPKFIITMKLWDANPKYLIIDSKNIL